MEALDEIEKTFKELYQKYPKEMSAEIEPAGLADLLRRRHADLPGSLLIPLEQALTEAGLFKEGESIAICRHKRYLPPIRHSHSFIEIIYVCSGACENTVDGQPVSLEAGDVCILAPENVHTLSVFSDDALVYNILVRTSTFDTTFFGLLSDRDVLSRFFMQVLYGQQENSYLIFRTGNRSNLADFFHFLLSESQEAQDYKNRMMNSLFTSFMIVLLRHHEKDVLLPQGHQLSGGKDLMLILNYIQSNFAHLTLDGLAGFFGYSSRHMARLVRESSGMGFRELVNNLRLKRAALLLENPENSISAVMDAAGYSDASSFYRLFKQAYQQTPVEYRESRKC